METVVFILVFVVIWAWIEIYRSKESYRTLNAALSQRVWSLEKHMENLQKALLPESGQQPAQPVAHPAPPPVPRLPTIRGTCRSCAGARCRPAGNSGKTSACRWRPSMARCSSGRAS